MNKTASLAVMSVAQGEIRNLRNRAGTEWPLYAVSGDAFDRKVWRADGRFPSLCMIDPECNISYPVTLSEVMYPSVKSFVRYLHQQTQRYPVRHNDSIYAVNPVIDMGNVGIREIRRADLRLVNKSSRCMTVLSVEPHCDCTTVGSYDKTVMPGDTLAVNVEFQSTSIGEFEREVEVRMDGLDTPVVYTLLGSVGRNRILY